MTARRNTGSKSEQLNRQRGSGPYHWLPGSNSKWTCSRITGQFRSSTSLAREPRQQGQLINAHVI